MVFGADGAVGRTMTITGLTAQPGRVHQVSSGSFVLSVTGSSSIQLGPDRVSGIHRLTVPLLRVAKEGTRVDTISMLPGSEIEIQERSLGPARFAKSLSYDVAEDEIYIGTADRIEVAVYSPEGKPVRFVRAPQVDVRLTPDMDKAYRDFLHSRYADASPERRAEGERSIAEIKLPDSVPSYDKLLLDAAGNMWLGEYRFDLEPPRRFVVFDRDGRLTTSVVVRDGFVPMWITRDRVWGRATDELNVQYVVAYAIQAVTTRTCFAS